MAVFFASTTMFLASGDIFRFDCFAVVVIVLAATIFRATIHSEMNHSQMWHSRNFKLTVDIIFLYFFFLMSNGKSFIYDIPFQKKLQTLKSPIYLHHIKDLFFIFFPPLSSNDRSLFYFFFFMLFQSYFDSTVSHTFICRRYLWPWS